jgi:3-isopropylmalate dehydrogenase
VSLILSAAMLFDWYSRKGTGREAFARAAAAIERTADEMLVDPARRTADLGGALGTRAFADAFCAALKA